VNCELKDVLKSKYEQLNRTVPFSVPFRFFVLWGYRKKALTPGGANTAELAQRQAIQGQ